MNKQIAKFSRKIAKEVADKSFGHVLDCILGYSDRDYDLTTDTEEFEQNFEEDLKELGITPTSYKVKIVSEEYEKMRTKFEGLVRKKYYEPNKEQSVKESDTTNDK